MTASLDVLAVLTRHVKDLHEGVRYGESINDMDEVVTAVAALITRNAGLEKLRPVWAEGWSDDSVAAQCSAAALAQLWELLEVTDQTAAVLALRKLKGEG